jgi:hypothetical protein
MVINAGVVRIGFRRASRDRRQNAGHATTPILFFSLSPVWLAMRSRPAAPARVKIAGPRGRTQNRPAIEIIFSLVRSMHQ